MKAEIILKFSEYSMNWQLIILMSLTSIFVTILMAIFDKDFDGSNMGVVGFTITQSIRRLQFRK